MNDVALGEADQPQRYRGKIDGRHRHRRGLTTRQHEHSRVEYDAWRKVRYRDRQRGVLDESEAALSRHTGAERQARGHTGRQPGDADLITLPCYGAVRNRGRQTNPVFRREVGAADGRDGKFNACARRVGVRFGLHLAHEHANRPLHVGQRLLIRRIIRRPLHHRLPHQHRLGVPVQSVQCIRHQQQTGDFPLTRCAAGEAHPGGEQRQSRLRWRAPRLRPRQIEKLF